MDECSEKTTKSSGIVHNAVIHGTYLGLTTHGILTCVLRLQGSGWTQDYGGFALDGLIPPPLDLASTIRRLLTTLGVQRWEEIPGQVVRVQRMGDSIHSDIVAIGHALDDRWFSLKVQTVEGSPQ